MSCQLIRAQDWDQMVESGRVGARAGTAVGMPSGTVAPRPISPPAPPAPPPSGPDHDGELLTLLSSVRDAERQLQSLLAQLQAEVDRVSRATAGGSGAAGGCW